ncbi:SURF1 family protein [Frateuria aurantia]
MNSWRRPSWFAWVLLLAGIGLFVRLGFWQLHRADEKQQLLDRYALAATAPVQAFDASAAMRPQAAYPRYQVEGRYLADRIYLLDNPKHDERGGVEVYIPLQRAGDQRMLLVDLGFLPGNGSDQAPQLPALDRGDVALHGLYVPPPGVGFEMGGNALSRQTRWPKTTVYLSLSQLAADLGAPLYPRVLSLDPDGGSIYQRQHALDVGNMPPARHRAYAFQWFTFAVVAFVIFILRHRKPRSRDVSKL